MNKGSKWILAIKKECPCVVEMIYLAVFYMLAVLWCMDYGWYGGWLISCIQLGALGIIEVLLEAMFIHKDWYRYEQMVYLSIETGMIFIPIIPYILACGTSQANIDKFISLLALLLTVFGVRTFSWIEFIKKRKTKKDKEITTKTSFVQWICMICGNIASQIITVVSSINAVSMNGLERTFSHTFAVSIILMLILWIRYVVERHLVKEGIIDDIRIKVLTYLDLTNITMLLIWAVVMRQYSFVDLCGFFIIICSIACMLWTRRLLWNQLYMLTDIKAK